MKRYPGSFLQLVTFGYILVVIPFLLASSYVFITLDALDKHYSVAIRDFSETSRLISEITEDLLHMQRRLRRFEVLRDTDSLNDYTRVRSEWQANVESLSRLSTISAHVASELKVMIQTENTAHAVMQDTQKTGALHLALDEIKQRFAEVRGKVRKVLVEDQDKFKLEADVLRQRLLLAMGVAVLTALCLILLGRQLLSRLIGRFEKAILRLGKGDLRHPIDLHGPGDMRWLGRWLEWLRRRLKSLEEARTQVLRHVSHELKTPLTAMREGTNLLAEEVPGPLTVEQARIVQILQSNSKRLQDLIEGLLRLQQAGHAAERLNFECLRFDQLIEQVLETHRLIAAERNVEFRTQLPEVQIIAGHEGLLTIVHNLLSNAIKFSPEGGCVSISLSKDGEHAVLDVSDEGTGVAVLDKAKIFEPFYRSSASRLIAGVGLGLAIAREFVQAHRGELILLDSLKGGAHFRVVLPLKATFVRTQQHA